jgi:putative addiction module CopG family antidote
MLLFEVIPLATMNISLPDKMREWIDQQVASGRYSNASDLMRDLIRDAQSRTLAAGFTSRPPHETTKA